MNLEEYRILSKRTFKQLDDFVKDDIHVRLGIITEIGELLDVFKKWLAYDVEFDYVNASEEIADCMFYQVNAITLEDGEVNQDRFNYWYNEYLEQHLDLQNLDDDKLKIELANLLLSHHWCMGEVEQDIAILFIVANSLNIDFYRALENNINKLKVRYPRAFDNDKAINRDLEQERKELEK